MNASRQSHTESLMNDEQKAAARSRVGLYLTARQMALRSHRLSRDGMTASTKDGGSWKWSAHFSVWACVAAK